MRSAANADGATASNTAQNMNGYRNISRGLLLLLLAGIVAVGAKAEDRTLKISIPKRGKLTPVQSLNRDGVQAIRKNQIEKAESLFYKAYLFDPDDPFTLNNLGYISELKGDFENAHRFY